MTIFLHAPIAPPANPFANQKQNKRIGEPPRKPYPLHMNLGTDSAIPKYRITGVEAFAIGSYGEKGDYTEADLDEMSASYDPNVHAASTKFDHIDQGPAGGWLANPRRVGKKLLVDIVGATKAVADGFLGEWKNRSIEIYRDFNGTGKPYIRGLALLGAAAPHVKGLAHVSPEQIAAMKDAGERFITLSGDTNGAFAFYDYGMSPVEGYEPPAMDEMPLPYVSAPYGSPAGMNATATRALVIVDSEATGETRGHKHVADLSKGADGWTSPPCYCGPAIPGDTHQHVIERGVVLPALDGLGVMHTHELELESEDYQIESINAMEAMNMNDKTPNPAPNTTDPTPAPAPPVDAERAAKFAEMEARFAAIEADNARMTVELAATKRKARDASFDSAWDKALGEGRCVPAQRAHEFAIFNALCDGNGAVVNFGENAEHAPADAYLIALSERPASGITATDVAGAASNTRVAAINFGDSGDADQVAANRRTEAIMKFKADNKIASFTDAALAYSAANPGK